MNRFEIEEDCAWTYDAYTGPDKRPVIGITGNFGEKGCELAEGYYQSIEDAGGIPIILPPTEDETTILSFLDHIDGLLLSGGSDLNPLYLNEDPIPALGQINPKRDRYELLLTRFAYNRNLPIFGICRGIQILCAALGGKIHQDLPTCLPNTDLIKHSQNAPRHIATHRVRSEKGSVIASLLGEHFAVNSFHHQAVSECGPLLRPTAFSSDGVIEAVESTEFKSVIGVQWHPECFCTVGDDCMYPLFMHFIRECSAYREARDLHNEILTLDSHCDTPMCFAQGARFGERSEKVCVDKHKMREGGLDAAIMVAYLPQKGRNEEELAAATQTCNQTLDSIRKQVEQNKDTVLADSADSILAAKNNGKRCVVMGIENGYALGKDLSNIERYRKEGVVYITLCHNGDNDLCDAALKSRREHHGLSEFGKKAVAEMNRCGMLIDLSHASEETFYDVLRESSQPVVCSHSSARSLCDHPRNLTDEQIRAIAAKGGVVQATFYNYFLRKDGEATIEDAVRHILHLIKTGGVDAVGIGSDFDGDGGVRGLRNASDLINLTRWLLAAEITKEDLKKIWGGNFLRVMQKVQGNASISSNTPS